MLDFYTQKKKRRVLVVSIILLAVLMLSNFVGTSDYNRLEKNMSSIYNDRLMPAYYLFRINDHLYQKKILLNNSKQNAAAIAKHNQDVDSLVTAYSLTYLTAEEKREWTVFLTKLKQYNIAEMNALTVGNNFVINEALFTEVLASLSKLNTIQASVGKQLHSSTKAIVYGSVIYTYLQVALMIILLLIILMTLRSSDHILSGAHHPQSLN